VGGPASNANRTDPHQVFAGHVGTLPPQARRTGQHQAAVARASTSQQVRPRSISGTRTRSVDASASQSIPQVQWAPPPRPRDALFPELANDSNFYPGLVPAAHEFHDDDNPFARKRSKGMLWYVAYAVAGMTLVGAGVALFNFWRGPTTVSVMVETTPREATVTIDGRALASAASPYTLAGLATGEHVLQVQKPGFEDYRQVLTLSEQETKRVVSVNLNAVAKAEPPPVEPIAAPEPQAAVPPPPPVSKWHAKSKGSASTAGMSAQEIAKQHRSEVRAAKIAAHWREAHGLPPRENTLADSVDVTEVSRPTHAKHEPRAPRQAREPREPREAASHSASSAAVAAPAAESGTGTLQINSRPWANVYVDGQMVGHTPQMGLSLPAGRHTIKLENPTMNMSKSLSVTIHAGQTVTKVETLSE
jgi:hypothetical protein